MTTTMTTNTLKWIIILFLSLWCFALTWLELNNDYRLDEMEMKIQQQQTDNTKMRYLIEHQKSDTIVINLNNFGK